MVGLIYINNMPQKRFRNSAFVSNKTDIFLFLIKAARVFFQKSVQKQKIPTALMNLLIKTTLKEAALFFLNKVKLL